jgi:hypothetical protein
MENICFFIINGFQQTYSTTIALEIKQEKEQSKQFPLNAIVCCNNDKGKRIPGIVKFLKGLFLTSKGNVNVDFQTDSWVLILVGYDNSNSHLL